MIVFIHWKIQLNNGRSHSIICINNCSKIWRSFNSIISF